MDEKFSTKQQWHEKPTKPVVKRQMTKQEIEHFRVVLAQSYGCPAIDVTFAFEKITEEEDEDKDDHIRIVYRLKSIVADGSVKNRVIYSIKIPIPEVVKRAASTALRQQSQK